ncbi:hypothetical protein VTJ49DRAFT_6536 [Mycothermus thermophilus]|uniref:Uncharacterized protein n=1 Tax=Humicola insolens TaxID=85995 RepID=A0ABR3V195_HUMIN
MWQRFKIVPHNSGRELQVGHPLDDDSIHVGLGIGFGAVGATPKGYSYSIKGGPAPPRPPREFLDARYETSAAVKEPPPRNPSRLKIRTTNIRPPSSIYSKDSPPLDSTYTATVATKYGHRYGGADEISPPSSPEPDARGTRGAALPGDVSPIDEDDGSAAYMYKAGIPNTDHTRLETSDTSYVADPRHGYTLPSSDQQPTAAPSIPALRRERRRQADAAAREAHLARHGQSHQQSRNVAPRDAPRYDPLAGDQMRGTHSRPPQGLGTTSRAFADPQPSPTAAPSSFGDRVRRIAKKAAAKDSNADPAAGAFTSTRPSWRGASGRTAIVEPVRDDPEAPPLTIPEKSSKRIIPTGLLAKKSSAADSTARSQTPPVSPPPTDGPVRPRKILSSAQPQQTSSTQAQPRTERRPSPPLASNPVSSEAPAVAAARNLVRDGQFASPAPSPSHYAPSPEPGQVVRRKPPPVHTNHLQHQHQHQVSVSSAYSQLTEVPHPSPRRFGGSGAPAEIEEPYVQPPSRFSITTYATSNAGTSDEPAADDQPPVPALPTNPTQRKPSDHSPVTSPIDQFMTSPFADQKHPQTKKHPALARAQAQDTPSSPDRPASRASDIDKALPPAPPEQTAESARDRVGLLNAQLRALANRRININRSIQQMTELMPADRLMDSDEVARKRDAEKKKVEALRSELADIQRDEYELGLKLHRAYKRLDREGEFEASTLWVRRVTG